MKEITSQWDFAKIKKGYYWVYCSVVKKVIFSEFVEGKFYVYSFYENDKYQDKIINPTKYKKVLKPNNL